METNQLASPLRAAVQQVTNNTTSWIGHQHGESRSRISGQTFTCPTDGELERIAVLSAHVTNDGPVHLTLHSFDEAQKSWGPVLKSTSVEFKKQDTGKWIAFPFAGLPLQKGASYGFRLKSDAGLVGVGEAAGSNERLPFIGGQEWSATAEDQSGDFYSYLSLAFKVELRA